MNNIPLYKILLTCSLLLLFTTAASAQNEFKTPEQYAQIVQKHFTDEEWEEGKKLLDESFDKFQSASDLQWLMGKYWHHKKDHDKARFHLIKAVEANYNNVNAKHLLVDVEEVTNNYSSAICYINELLEVNPYWQGLWRRKIILYRKQGNDIEANRLLKRINQIYPNDSVLRKDYIYSVEEGYLETKKSGSRKEAINQLNELIKISPKNEEYYLDMINLYLQEGEPEAALGWTASGLNWIPQSTALINKRVGILSELSRHPEALTFLRAQMKTNRSPALRRMHNNLLIETARAEKQKDPYVLYGMLYESGDRSKEVLDYLLSTSLTRGYNDDALHYIREAKRRYGSTDKGVLYKEYLLHRKMNEEELAYSSLSKLYQMHPNDYDIAYAMCEQHMKRAEKQMEYGLYSEALPHLTFVAGKQIDTELSNAAREKILNCHINLKRYNEALAALDTLTLRNPNYESNIGRRASILDKMGRKEEALQLYLSAIQSNDSEMRAFYVIGYEEIAIPYIKECIEAGATRKAYELANQLIELNPSSELGLRYAINSAGVLGKYDKFDEYTNQGISFYPNEPFFQVKQAAIFDREKKYDQSIGLLQPTLQRYPSNRELIGAFSQSSELQALQLLKAKECKKAHAVLDTALVYDTQSRTLKYTKGLAFEIEKQADSAYYYQKFYEPSIMEYKAFQRHLNGLINAGFKNDIALTYLQARYGEEDVITAVATAEYTKKGIKDIFTGRLNYSGRDGFAADNMSIKEQTPGGIGVQLQGEWTHQFSDKWSGMFNAAYATRYFPQMTAALAASYYLKNDWVVGFNLGYRRPESYEKKYVFDGAVFNETTQQNGVWLFDSWKKSRANLFTAGASVAKTIDQFWLNSKLDFHLYNSSIYYNAQVVGKYFPLDDGRTSILATASVGSAPEASTLNYALPGSFSHTNTMVGLGGQYLLNANVSVGLTGTWNTYYNQTSVRLGGFDDAGQILINYKNLYNIYAQVFISF